mmetsp:Transcript_38821/g.95983  ORF Transcript_38821/g.95983 Transcript_38821/m.95983 type:complete len:208 (-) Transcript_38821:1028-1651(-)
MDRTRRPRAAGRTAWRPGRVRGGVWRDCGRHREHAFYRGDSSIPVEGRAAKHRILPRLAGACRGSSRGGEDEADSALRPVTARARHLARLPGLSLYPPAAKSDQGETRKLLPRARGAVRGHARRVQHIPRAFAARGAGNPGLPAGEARARQASDHNSAGVALTRRPRRLAHCRDEYRGCRQVHIVGRRVFLGHNGAQPRLVCVRAQD